MLEDLKQPKDRRDILLVEILSEELPAIPFLKEKSKILEKWKNILEEYQLKANFDFFYTPRRMVLISRDFPLKQEDRELEFFGPPLEIAYVNGDVKEGLSKAGESFLKKCNVSEVQTRQKEGKECLYFSQRIKGRESCEFLGEMIAKWLKSLQFGKSMRWGDLSDSFIRPIRNIAVLLGDRGVEFELFGVRSSLKTFLHRDFGFEARSFASLEEYLQLLKEGGVILDPQKRREKILQEIKEIEKQRGLSVELDESLLDEVVTITEYPRALLGEFEEQFLALPKEVIITSMKENQRYFAVYKDGALHQGFIVVINSMSEDVQMIIEGNERVLRARLSDAMFFYHNDLKKPLDSYDLSKIAFVEGLGSMADKIDRERVIVKHFSKGNAEALEAVKISKSDLLSEMVGEFPELQGIMGEYYVLAEAKRGVPKRNESIALAIREQYFFAADEGKGAISKLGAYLALAYRLDLLMALFSIGKIPSGSKDPYALRRAGNAILKILQTHQIGFRMDDLQELSSQYQSFELSKLWDFLLERIEGVLGINPSILRSVVAGYEKDLGKIMQKCLALNEIFEKVDKEAFISLFKRVANITKDAVRKPIDPTLFQMPQEKNLYAHLQEIQRQNFGEIKAYIEALFGLRTPLEAFFEAVMVNVDEEALKENRKALIYEIYAMFLEIGDIKEITN